MIAQNSTSAPVLTPDSASGCHRRLVAGATLVPYAVHSESLMPDAAFSAWKLRDQLLSVKSKSHDQLIVHCLTCDF